VEELEVEPVEELELEPEVETEMEPEGDQVVEAEDDPVEVSRRKFMEEYMENGMAEGELLENVEKLGGWENFLPWVFPCLPRRPHQCRFCRICNSNIAYKVEFLDVEPEDEDQCERCYSMDEITLFMKYAY
jgi:hypothetical protein